MHARCYIGIMIALALEGRAQQLPLTVTNPSPVARPNEPVVVEWTNIIAKLPAARASNLHIADETGRLYQYQVDDIDQDGRPDELVFLADFAGGQSKTFMVHDTTERFSTGAYMQLATDAQNWKRVGGVLQSLDDDDGPGLTRDQTRYRFDGIGWESELVGYRVYLDERNAVDLQAKRRPGLHWKFIGSTLVDYQQNSDWGMDPLHVGPALGVGGIAFWVGDSVHKPVTLERRRARVIARGPVRAVVRIDYGGWDVGGEKIDVSSVFTICAGDRTTEHRVLLRSGGVRSLVTGIVRHDSSTVKWDAAVSRLVSRGRQSRAGDELYLALQFHPEDVVRKTQDAYNDLVVFKAQSGRAVRFLISARWEGESGGIWSEKELENFQRRVYARLREPLAVGFQ